MGFPGEPACSAGDPEETRVGYLGREDPLEEDLATHSSILAGESHGQSSLTGYYRVAKSQTQLT